MSQLAASAASVTPGSLRAWVLAARPATLTAALAPVLVGTACVLPTEHFRLGPALGALVGALLLQVAANFANDVFDYEKGADTAERLGPVRAVQAGLLTPSAVRQGLWVVLALAFAVGIYLTWQAGPAIVVIGLASMAAAVAYTGGPYPLGYHGLGDLFVFVFFGWVAVCGSAYVHAGAVSELSLLAAVAPGALSTAILVVNNLRDRETDVRAGKRTLAVRFGRRAALGDIFASLAAAYATPAALFFSGRAGAWVLLPWLTAPGAFYLASRLPGAEGRAHNPLLVKTAKLLFAFGVLFAVGIALGARPPR